MLKAIYVTVMVGAIGAALLSVQTARAAGPDFCRDYAQAAVNQVRGGLANPRCVGGMRGPEWSPEYHVHYDWCLGATREAADQQRDLRTGYLRGCR